MYNPTFSSWILDFNSPDKNIYRVKFKHTPLKSKTLGNVNTPLFTNRSSQFHSIKADLVTLERQCLLFCPSVLATPSWNTFFYPLINGIKLSPRHCARNLPLHLIVIVILRGRDCCPNEQVKNLSISEWDFAWPLTLLKCLLQFLYGILICTSLECWLLPSIIASVITVILTFSYFCFATPK